VLVHLGHSFCDEGTEHLSVVIVPQYLGNPGAVTAAREWIKRGILALDIANQLTLEVPPFQ